MDAELNARKRAVGTLLVLYRETREELAEVYLRETQHIPLDKLQLAVRALIRTHRWPRCPSIADLCETAKHVAGMHREQYRAGRYVGRPDEWPPPGQRHGIHVGSLEPIRSDHLAIPERVTARLSDGLHHEGELP